MVYKPEEFIISYSKLYKHAMRFTKSKRGVCAPGFRAAGIREGKYGVAVITADAPCTVAGVFTKNAVASGGVLLDRQRIRGRIQAIVANSGNANTCVPSSFDDAMAMADGCAKELGIGESRVAVASTGIIGKPLDVEKVNALTRKAVTGLSNSMRANRDAAQAIMTTDSNPKSYAISHRGVHVGGIAKGAGMIHPDMATMLAFITTNAKVEKKQLQSALGQAVEDSFNMVSVDGDMSTNDSVLVLASGEKTCSSKVFSAMLAEVCRELARMIAHDGEGASKAMEVVVTGAKSKQQARAVARAITTSPLIKTAVYGANPNWGRIVMRVGAVTDVSFEKMRIALSSSRGKMTILSGGKGKTSTKKSYGRAQAILRAKSISIAVDLGTGKESATAWGCDLTPEYVRINAEYN